MNRKRKETEKWIEMKAELHQLRVENKWLKEFAIEIISRMFDGLETDNCDTQELAEKHNLIKAHIVIESDIDENSEYEVGETTYKYTDILIDQAIGGNNESS